MNRRNFLAFIPAISAAPLVGSNILTFDDKIEIIKPEPLVVTTDKSLLDLELHFMRGGKSVGRAIITHADFQQEFAEVTSRGGDGWKRNIPTTRSLTVTAVLTGALSL